MADCLPFNATLVDEQYDRVYKAEDWAWYFATFIANGVFPKPSDGLQVIAYDKMEIKVNVGYAFINGYAFRNPERQSIILCTAEGALNRIDRVIIRWDLIRRDIYLDVLKGVPSAKPAATALTRNTEIWELAIADIYVGKGVTKIQTKDITDQRFNSAVCGIVKGTIEEIDASVLTKQFNDFFTTYSKEVIEKYGIYVNDMGNYFDQISSQGQQKYEEFKTEIITYINSLKVRGDTDLADLLQELLDFKDKNEGDFLAWFEGIREVLAAAENGKLLAHIEYLLEILYEVGEPGDIDEIVSGIYRDDDDGDNGYWEVGTQQDIDEIIGGTYLEEEPEHVTQQKIQELVDKSFEEV